MGKVVKLGSGGPRTGRPFAARAGPRTAGRAARGRPSKAALVLGGGGFTGAVYEIGALRALGLLSVSRSINAFDVYVGTSAGASAAGAPANGTTPQQMMQAIVRDGREQLPDVRMNALLRPNYREFVSR